MRETGSARQWGRMTETVIPTLRYPDAALPEFQAGG